jgi:hypothetical protein
MQALKTECGLVEREASEDFERIRLPLSAMAQSDPLMVELLHYWQSRRQGDLLPAKGDIDPISLKPFLGRLLERRR